MIRKQNYIDLNNSFTREVVFQMGTLAGFFSEYNSMIFSMLYSLDHRIRFVLSTNNANFDKEKGWRGFFEPFCEERKTNKEEHYSTANWRFAVKSLLKGNWNARRSLYPYLKSSKQSLLTQDVFGRARDPHTINKHYTITEIDICGDFTHACGQLIALTWVFNAETKQSIDEKISSVALPEQYISCQIRGGDKDSEFPLLSVEQYIKRIAQQTDCKHIFILTDDYAIFEQCKANYPQYTWYTLCEKNEKGYFHQQFKQGSTFDMRMQYINLFASIEVFSRSEYFFGTLTSNPGAYMALRCPEIFVQVDEDTNSCIPLKYKEYNTTQRE